MQKLRVTLWQLLLQRMPCVCFVCYIRNATAAHLLS
jgi:hypothetical protein